MANVKISYKLPIAATRANAAKCIEIITIMLNTKVRRPRPTDRTPLFRTILNKQYLLNSGKLLYVWQQNRRKTSTFAQINDNKRLKMEVSLYEYGREDAINLQKLFFRRFKYIRTKKGEGLQVTAANMRAQGTTLSYHSLDKYERPQNREIIRLSTLFIYARYVNKSLNDMIQPLTDEEEAEFRELRKKYIQRTEHITKGRTSKTRA